MPGGASVSSWHRQQQKKQQQKNKTERIAARDKAVVESKTEREIQEEIRNVLKPHKSVKDEALLPHGVKSKLDRLRKELRLVQEHAKHQASSSNHPASSTSSHTKNQRGEPGPSFQKLENPQISVYYDPVLNPYGAPPPGQPMLYHRRGGGVTMNLNEANWMPHPIHQHPEHGNEVSVVQQASPLDPPRTSHVSTPPPPSPPLPPPPPPPPPSQKSTAPHPGGVRSKGRISKPTEPEAIQHRPRRKILDVWAHEEEAELVEKVENVGETGDGERSTQDAERSTREKSPLASPAIAANADSRQRTLEAQLSVSSACWYYRDQAGAVQGPYETLQMQQWIEAGYFPRSTPVRPAHNHPTTDPPWSTLDKQAPFSTCFASLPATDIREGNAVGMGEVERARLLSTEEKTDDENEDDAIQARIAALKAGQSPNNRTGQMEHSDQEHSVEVLRQPQKQPFITSEVSVQDRIAALREERRRDLSEAPSDDEKQHHLSSVQERIQALRHSRGGNVAEDVQQSPPPPPPPPRAPSAEHGGANEPADDLYYPVDTDHATLVARGGYPVDDSFVSIEQDTVDGSNEYDGISATAVYPVTDAYPMDDDDEGDVLESSRGSEDGVKVNEGFIKKRQYQADAAVVALLPSHLQNKRRPPAREPNTASVDSSSGSGSVRLGSSYSGDLERFFQDVDD
jgi:GYF domain/mRNA biogenesis factor